ncbi:MULTISPECIES: hypothetical protein [Streptomyces]|uniref:Transposase n=1 Tax=Streptomyces changanensis TaxID=2964669 RepID=A0ABY5NEN0_9ACTN|nr:MULTISPECIES: hypothetical protein [Streptomyces]UUS34507.1 hypothetical protein NRO40_29260 [Streptomyces changanensis]
MPLNVLPPARCCGRRSFPRLREGITHAIAADETWRLAPHRHYRGLTDGRPTHRDED